MARGHDILCNVDRMVFMGLVAICMVAPGVEFLSGRFTSCSRPRCNTVSSLMPSPRSFWTSSPVAGSMAPIQYLSCLSCLVLVFPTPPSALAFRRLMSSLPNVIKVLTFLAPSLYILVCTAMVMILLIIVDGCWVESGLQRPMRSSFGRSLLVLCESSC